MKRLCTLCLIVLSGSGLSGCSSLNLTDLTDKLGFRSPAGDGPVMDLLCLWEQGEGRSLDNLPSRGFAGQLMFLRHKSSEPSRVDGDIRIYLFDDQGTMEERAKPIHQFDFPSEVWNRYLCETNLGPAYQVFLPYTRKGSHEAHCALRVRFTPADGGPPVYSKMAYVTLPGPSTPLEQPWTPERTQASAAARKGNHADASLDQALHQVRASRSMRAGGSDVQLALAEREQVSGGRAQQLARLQQILAESIAENGVTTAEHNVLASEPPQGGPEGRRYRLHQGTTEPNKSAAPGHRDHPLAGLDLTGPESSR